MVPDASALERFSDRAEAELLAAVREAGNGLDEEGEDEEEEDAERQHARAVAAAAAEVAVENKAALAAALGRLVASQARASGCLSLSSS